MGMNVRGVMPEHNFNPLLSPLFPPSTVRQLGDATYGEPRVGGRVVLGARVRLPPRKTCGTGLQQRYTRHEEVCVYVCVYVCVRVCVCVYVIECRLAVA